MFQTQLQGSAAWNRPPQLGSSGSPDTMKHTPLAHPPLSTHRSSLPVLACEHQSGFFIPVGRGPPMGHSTRQQEANGFWVIQPAGPLQWGSLR